MKTLSNTTPKPGDRIKLVSNNSDHTGHQTVRTSVTVDRVTVDRWGDTIAHLTSGNHWIIYHGDWSRYVRSTNKMNFTKTLVDELCEVTR